MPSGHKARPPRVASKPCEALGDWLRANFVRQDEFADMVSVGKGAVGHWIHRGSRPDDSIMARITRATRGAITASDWEG